MFAIGKFLIGGAFPLANALMSLVSVATVLGGIWVHGYSAGKANSELRNIRAQLAAANQQIEANALAYNMANVQADEMQKLQTDNAATEKRLSDVSASRPAIDGCISAEFLDGLRKYQRSTGAYQLDAPAHAGAYPGSVQAKGKARAIRAAQ